MDPIEQKLALLRNVRKVFLGLAVVLLVVGGVLLARSASFVKSAQRVDAEVTHVESRKQPRSASDSHKGPRYLYQPTFAFDDAEGRRHVVGLTHWSTEYDYEVGQRVAILYDPADPKRVWVASFFGVWGVGVIVFGLGVGTALLGLALSSAVSTLKKQQDEQGAGEAP
jgi:hypothetical protein